MRAYDGQRSDGATIKRSREEKRLQLMRLRDEFAGLKPTVSETIRSAMVKRIQDLERELDDTAPSRPADHSGRTAGSRRPER